MGMSTASADDRALHIEIRHVPVLRPLTWLHRGWLDLCRHWNASVGHGALILMLGWTLLMLWGTHPYFVAAAISGFLLVGPIMSAGLYEMSRRYSLGQSANFDDSLNGFTRNTAGLFGFGILLAICTALWFAISAILLGTVFHLPAPDMRETLYGFLEMVNRAQIVAYITTGAVLAGAVFTVSVVAVPLIIDRHASASQGMRASVHAVFKNIPAMIVWSALIVILMIIGYLVPFLAGLLVVVPLLGHATWYAYKDMVG
jgi:uncharacterized membrane protein